MFILKRDIGKAYLGLDKYVYTVKRPDRIGIVYGLTGFFAFCVFLVQILTIATSDKVSVFLIGGSFSKDLYSYSPMKITYLLISMLVPTSIVYFYMIFIDIGSKKLYFNDKYVSFYDYHKEPGGCLHRTFGCFYSFLVLFVLVMNTFFAALMFNIGFFILTVVTYLILMLFLFISFKRLLNELNTNTMYLKDIHAIQYYIDENADIESSPSYIMKIIMKDGQQSRIHIEPAAYAAFRGSLKSNMNLP